MDNYSINFGKKERVLNYACQTYQLSRPNKVGAVMSLIRECQPNSFEQWEQWYFSNAYTESKKPIKVTQDSLQELGERLYVKIMEVVRPEWENVFKELTQQDCIDYIYNLTINRTYDGYIREKSIVNDGLAKLFPNIDFQESDPELDHAGDVDYVAKVGQSLIGIQIKPITAKANFGGYSLTERMKESFDSFKEGYGGRVFVILSLKGEIANSEVIDEIKAEIEYLTTGK
ncbi:MAG: MjaI family restriction endonuclease [Bacteroidota bacterium]|nr:MjaI family restriction endonuclease [Bacteroidota bacterium]